MGYFLSDFCLSFVVLVVALCNQSKTKSQSTTEKRTKDETVFSFEFFVAKCEERMQQWQQSAPMTC